MSAAGPGDRTLAVSVAGERLLLHPQRALVWPARRTLLIADPHFGKDDIFRRAGIALPRGPAIADLQRVSALLQTEDCNRLVVLGDFLHGPTRAGDAFRHAFGLWRRSHPELQLDIVAGNHDRREPADPWRQLASWHTRPLIEPPFVFAHEPGASQSGYLLAGHLHPVIRLRAGAESLRIPVFWQREHYFVMPSFGSFTGGAIIDPEEGDLVYAAAPERVVAMALPTRTPARAAR